MPASDYDAIFQAAGREWNVDPTLLKAIAEQESRGNPKAVSPKGAAGVMGIMPDTQKEIGIIDPADPVQSIYGAAKHLSGLLDVYKTPEKALAAYNAGSGRINDVLSGKATLPNETAAYLPAVEGHYKRFSATPAAPTGTPDVSDDDFLKRTAGADSKPKSAEDDATFLARTGASSAPPPPAEPESDPTLTNNPDMPPTAAQPVKLNDAQRAALTNSLPDAAGRVLSAVGQGATEGWRTGGLQLNPLVQDQLDRAGSGGVTRLLSGAMSAGNALVGGAGAGIARFVKEAGGSDALGRDLAAMVQNPQALSGTPVPMNARGPQAAAPSPRFVQEYYGEGTPANPLAAPPGPVPNPLAKAVNAPAFVPPNTPVPALPRILELLRADDTVAAWRPDFVPPSTAVDPAGAISPVRQPPNPLAVPAARVVPPGAIPAETNALAGGSVGAAASREQTPASAIALTPAQTQAYRSVSEGQKLNEPQPVGLDTARYVPGVEPTMAHMEQSANVSREQKMLESVIPTDFKNAAREHNEARQEYFNNIAGSDVDVQNAIDAREAQAQKDIDAAFKSRKPTDAQPVADAISAALEDPRGKENTQLQKYVAPLLDRLKNADGTLKNDPLQLYGLREDIRRMTSKASQADDKNLTHVAGELGDIIKSLDGVIEKGAPGYRHYMDNYAAASRPIDTMQVLQEHENRLYDTQGRMQLSRVQNMMKNVVDRRQAPGLNPYKSIPDETMAQLWNLRDDLRRVASAEELAKAKGSDTAQNAMDIVKGVGRAGGAIIAHGAANYVAPVAGSFVLNAVKDAKNFLTAKAAQRKMEARAAEMLHPDRAKYPPKNPLVP